MINSIKKEARQIHKEVISFRRHMHQHPELSFKEKKTGAFISKILKDNGIKHTKGWAGHGVVAIIEGTSKSKGKKKIIALRADIDALPIMESNKVSYVSKNKGIMHACGHDVHASSLLGVAIILNQVKSSFAGIVKLIFQPGEEKLPGGASIMIKEGVLKNPKPANILGQHVHPPLHVGKVGIRPGKYMASADEIYLKIIGKGGHAALPDQCVDSVYVTSQIIVALQEILSRKKNAYIPSVLSFGKIASDGGATNILPDVVHVDGTFRSMDEKWRFRAHKLIKRTAEKTAAAFGARCEVDIKVGYPCLHNDEELTALVKKDMIDYMGKSNVVDLPQRMTAEDFSWYSHVVPACFYRLGTGHPQKGITSPVHTSTFNVDENCLEIGAGLMAYLAIQQLSY